MKTMTISAFKAHISEELKKVRKGAHIIISDRDTPIAEVIPIEAKTKPRLAIREPTGPFVIPHLARKIDHDPLEFLMEDRNKR
jgi:prevent-host-death family protein